MKRKTIKTLALLMVLAMALSLLAGCGGSNTNNGAQGNNTAPANNAEPVNNTTPDNTVPANNTPANNADNTTPANNTVPENTVPDNSSNNVDPTNTVEPEPDGMVHSIEELLEAIKPGAEIVIAAGTYNLTEYLDEAAKNIDAWNAAHPYVQLQKCFDGVELVICNADGLSISGSTGSHDGTTLLVEPRYADVMVFEGGNSIRLANLTMGHTPDKGNCDGDVLHFKGSSDITLVNLDLFGCGTYALRTGSNCSRLTATNCTLRDCSEGAIYIEESTGDFVFENCVMSGSDSYPYFDTMMNAKLILKRCKLGLRESEWFPYDARIVMEDCELDENAEMPPDYEPGAAFSPADLDMMNAKDMVLPANCYAYVMLDVDEDILDAELVPYFDMRNGEVLSAFLGVYEDGTAELTGYFENAVKFKWEYTITGDMELTSDTVNCMLYFYQSGPEGYELYWARLELDTYAIWFQIL